MAQKKLGLTDLIAMSSGQVIGAGVVTLIGTAIACTGQAAWLAYGAAIFIGFLSIVPFILMSSTFMLKGGEYTIVANMFNEKAAGFYAIAFIAQCISLSIMGTSLGDYAASIFPGLNGKVVGIVFVTFFFVLNLAGVNVMAKVQKPLTAILILSLLVFGFYGMTQVDSSVYEITRSDFFLHGYPGFSAAIAGYAFSTYGQYMVMNFGKDAENPTRNIPIAILAATGIILIVYLSVAIADCGVLPISETSGRPLTVTAKRLFGSMYPLFIVGGPIMALLTTMNAQYGARSNPLLKAAQDGWFPQFTAKLNKHNIPYIIMSFVYLVGILPMVADWSIRTISSNLAFSGYLIRTVTAMSIIRLPKMFPEAWRKSFLHMSDPLFYGVMLLSLLANAYMVYVGARGLSPNILLGNIIFMVACVVYANLRVKSKKVKIDKTMNIEFTKD